MSVTFFVEPSADDVLGWRLEDYDGCTGSELFADRDSAVAALDALREGSGALPGCPDPEDARQMDCVHVETVYVGGPPPQLNVSNINAMTLLDVLGLRPAATDLAAEAPTSLPELVEYMAADDLFGSATADDMLGRILVAQAFIGEDAGVPAHNVTSNISAGGRRPGYLNDRLDDLSAVVKFAAARALTIYWS